MPDIVPLVPKALTTTMIQVQMGSGVKPRISRYKFWRSRNTVASFWRTYSHNTRSSRWEYITPVYDQPMINVASENGRTTHQWSSSLLIVTATRSSNFCYQQPLGMNRDQRRMYVLHVHMWDLTRHWKTGRGFVNLAEIETQEIESRLIEHTFIHYDSPLYAYSWNESW